MNADTIMIDTLPVDTPLPATVGQRQKSVRRCGFCKDGAHTEPFCELAKSRAEDILDELTSIRYLFENETYNQEETSIPDILHKRLNDMTMIEYRILSRKLQIESYSDSLKRRGVYTYEELCLMSSKRRYMALYMQYFLYDNYNLDTVAGRAERDEMHSEEDEDMDCDAGIIPIQTRIEPFLQTCHDKTAEMDCPICLNVYPQRNSAKLNCGHYLCVGCIHSYLNHTTSDNYKCCLCRAKIVDITFMDSALYNSYIK